MFPARRRIYCKPQLLWPVKLRKLRNSTFHQLQVSGRGHTILTSQELTWREDSVSPHSVTDLVSSRNVPFRCTRKRRFSQEGWHNRPQRRNDPCGMDYGTNIRTLCRNVIFHFSLWRRGLYVRTSVPPNDWHIIPPDYTADCILHGHRPDSLHLKKLYVVALSIYLTLEYQTKRDKLSYKRI
jgi:hypothetical protein